MKIKTLLLLIGFFAIIACEKNDEMQEIADLMVQYKLIDNNDIEGLVDDQFAKAVGREPVLQLEDIFKDSSQ